MPRETLNEFLSTFLRRKKDVAYVHRRGYRAFRWSYREVALSAFRMARELEARGLSRGDRVLVWGENCPEWVIAFLGCMVRGAVVVPMDRIASPDFAARVARYVDAKLLVGSEEQLRESLGLPTLGFEDLGTRLAKHSCETYPSPPLDRRDTVQIVFTSGTTADPKGVVISHGNILSNLEPLETEIGKYLRYERLFHPIRFLNLVPLSHVFGQFLGIFVPQLLGGTVVFQESLNPSEIIRTVKSERISVLVAVPRLLDSLRDKIERDYESEGKLDWLREQIRLADGQHFLKRWWKFREIHGKFGWKFWALISGGAALDPDTEVFWGRLSYVLIQGYGLTETTSLVSVNHPFKLGRGSIGKVLPGREIRLDDTGEILVRGESIASGYWQGRELRQVIGQEGWFHTGDVGELDSQGNLYFKGRKKNVIVTPEGMNIYPEDLESALKRQPEVRDCVVLPLEREGNAVPCAVLLLRDPADDADSAVRRANAELAEFQHMRLWFVWPEEDFPRTSTQKPRSGVILEALLSRGGGQVRRRASPGSIADLIGKITGREPASLDPAASLAADLSLSSIDRVELLSALEDRYQVDLNESRFSAATTVGDLERMLRQPLPRRSDYRYPRWAQRAVVSFVRVAVYYLLSWPATMILARPRIHGREKLKGVEGPLLIIANHVTMVDIGFVLAALPARLRHRMAVAMIGERLQDMRRPPREWGILRRWWNMLGYGLVVALFNVFPLPQKTGFRESFAFAGESVDRGFNVLVFPEGRRTPDGKLSRFQAGVGLLANNLGIPVLPVRIDGVYEVKISNKLPAPPGAIQVRIGSPVRFRPNDDPAAIARELEKRMASL